MVINSYLVLGKKIGMAHNNCSDCPQGDKCSEVYNQLGNSKCEPVLLRVTVAFLLPLVSFIVSYAIIESVTKDDSGFNILAALASVVISTIITATARLILFRKRKAA